MAIITSTKGPNLTNPGPDYQREQFLQLVNQLRIYFNTIDANNNAIKTRADGLNTLYWLGDY